MDKRRIRFIGPLLAAAILLAGCQGTNGLFTDAGSFSHSGDGSDRRLYLSVISGLQSSGQSRAALAYLDDYERQFPNDPQALVLRGEALIATGEAARAEEIFQEVIKRGYASQGYAGMGMASAYRGQWQRAAWFFQAAATADPANAKLLNNLGFALLKTSRPDEAYAALARASELDRSSGEIRNNFLLAKYWGGRRDAAMSQINSIEGPSERAALLNFVMSWNGASDAQAISVTTPFVN